MQSDVRARCSLDTNLGLEVRLLLTSTSSGTAQLQQLNIVSKSWATCRIPSVVVAPSHSQLWSRLTMVEFTVSPSGSVQTPKLDSCTRVKRKQVVTSILFAIGICAAVGRISVRIFYQRRLYPDDYVLAFGCVTLIASFALTNVMFENIYWDMSIILGPPELQLEIAMAPGFADRILLYQQQSFATEVLCWVTIFSVKTSFLLFFRQMIDRLKSILTFWKVTVAVTILAGIYCVCSIFIACPHFGLDASKPMTHACTRIILLTLYSTMRTRYRVYKDTCRFADR